ncbi:MAG: TadE/TadG family type IV pilus assembly protein [Novosphingobium sp.]
MNMRALLSRLLRDSQGMMAVETAVSATGVALLSLGSFQVSSFVARQNEMQGAAADAMAITLAKKPNTWSQLQTIKSIIMTSTGLPSEKVSVTYIFRCGNNPNMTYEWDSCSNNDDNKRWTYVRIIITDSYQPLWTKYGVGSGVNLKVDRVVQIS